MNASAVNLWIALGLALIVVIASVRQLRGSTAHPGRRWIVIALQIIVAALLYFCLVPPTRQQPAGGLVVLGTDAGKAGALPASAGPLLLLPEAADIPGAQRVPDLATALRQHPASTLTLVGAGLAARDRDALLPPDVRWQAAPEPRGWIALQPPADVAPGARFDVQAQARGAAGAKAELLDPADSVVDRTDVGEDGRVTLSGIARAEGRSVFQLRLLDADGHVVDSVPVPQQTLPAAPLRLLVRASAPGPELKYLRRWAADTGVRVQVQADTGAGVSVGDGAVALDAVSLARSDLLLLDERSLAALSAGQLAAVRQALREGLGVLVRSAGAPSASARQRLRDLGLTVQGDGSSRALDLPGDGDSAVLAARRGPLAAGTLPTGYGEEADRSSHNAPLPALEALELQAPGSTALLQDGTGKVVGGWHAAGKGRIGLLPITDSWRWVLAGRDDRHGELWSGVVATLARAQGSADALWSPQPIGWAGERQALCGVQAPLQVFNKRGDDIPLIVDGATSVLRCVGWWPREAGWQRLQHGDSVVWRYVFDSKDAPTLHRQAMIDATTRALAASTPADASVMQPVAGPRWPWWLAFVLCASLLWWLERRH
ncbi:hypothetical protein FEO89_00560 [Stenotrophomonas maltophilia]|uniref:hypothetical protein n=1 Tax=Stenotrophomonas maltophilia TaxID=40324 RepID=UPI0012B0C0D9|nr:hypothetical protein [Stenotrophomonas maltophilia]QGL99320.1 hypothetical protein FEO89_00560 [Stenotrophomonas maltophilia]QGM03479.1 hypothetical protein FEO88_00390 [Stenotrophomonas maltophilia]HDS1512019.1 hypothetical protein [Stenotrophomonas maltophilia]